MLSQIFAVFAFFAGIAAVAFSFSANIVTGEHMATVGVACFVFMGALGMWRSAYLLDKYLKRLEWREKTARELAQHPQGVREIPPPVPYT